MAALPPDSGQQTETVLHDCGRKYDEVNVVVSDLHMGEGPQVWLEYGGRRGVSRAFRVVLHRVFGQGKQFEEIDNKLEEFCYDRQFSEFLVITAERFSATSILRLRLLGDVFDPLTVAWEGRYEDPPYEYAATEKMRRIIEGHPEFFSALAVFIRRPNCHLDLFVGNHDLFIVWHGVQDVIRQCITGGNPEIDAKLRFIDQHYDYQLRERGVLYARGHEAEPHNYVRPENAIVSEVFGLNLKRPILNAPYGSHMVVDLVNRLKRTNPLVARVRSERRVWNHAFRYRWFWGIKAGILLVWHFIYAHLFAVADIRRKANLRKVLDIVAWTMCHHVVDDYAEELLGRHKNVKCVVLGHTHNWLHSSGQHGTYLNVGNWSKSFRLVEYGFNLTWGRFRRLEFACRAITHFFLTGEMRSSSRMTKFAALLGAIIATVAFICGAFDGGAWTFWPLPSVVVKVFAGIGLVFLLVAGAFRLFSVEPQVIPDTYFTFGLLRFGRDGSFKADVMEYDSVTKTVHERM